MIDMGFIDDIQAISAYVPKERQTLLFSATMPDNLASICNRITNDPKRIKTAIKVREEDLKQYYCEVDRTSKFSLLVHLLKKEDPDLGIIFCNRRSDVDHLVQNLRYNSINAEALHGGLTQSRRENTIERFHGGQIDLLVATDVAARGLDFKDVSHIFNYSVPNNPEDYVNRIGRTARAGKTGKAIVLLTREDFDSLSRVVNSFDYNLVEIEVKDYPMLPFRRGDGRSSRFGGDRRGGNGGNGRRFGGPRRQGGYGGGYGGGNDGHRRGYGGGNGGSGYGRDRDRGYGGSRQRDGYFNGGSGERRGGYRSSASSERSGPRQRSYEASAEGNSILSQGYSERRNSQY
jgi:ATP-dependent RNA helicase DeaD